MAADKVRAWWVLGGVVAIALVGASVGAWYALGGRADAAEHLGHHPPSPAIAHPEVSGMRVVSRTPVVPAVPAYDFELTDHSGAALALHDLRGRVVLLSFLYTNCPEACPLLSEHYLDLQRRFAAGLERGDLSLVLITTDPERDTPARLQEYTLARRGEWHFLTGELATMGRVWAGYGVYREARKELQDVVVYHSYKTFLIGPDGKVRYEYQGVWQADDVAADIESLGIAP